MDDAKEDREREIKTKREEIKKQEGIIQQMVTSDMLVDLYYEKIETANSAGEGFK